MDSAELALELQETFLLLYGSLLFYSLVLSTVASIALAVLLPLLSQQDDA